MKRNSMCPFCYIRQLFMKKRPSSVNPTFEDYLNAYKPYNLELWTLYGQGKVTKEWLHFQRF
ncbi:MAG: hypothetical protein J5713_00230, partial [Clostridia bacterium]|nr:hypothetical protein [Clostridia bacterium]